MSGRAAGYCAGYGVPGFANPVFGAREFGRGGGLGRGAGRGPGFGRGRGVGRWAAGPADFGLPYWGPATATLTQEQELERLKEQARYLETALGEIDKRIQDLGAKTEK
jgi:hypothetical protein